MLAHPDTLDPLAQDRPFVSPIVARHAEDAAFYWTTLDRPAEATHAVRAEAVIAWSVGAPGHARSPDAMTWMSNLLWQSVVEQAGVLAHMTGWYRVPARRRLDRWLRELAALVPVGHQDTAGLKTLLPTRQALNFSLHQGDPALLDFVVAATRDPADGRWAGWVWQCLTGVDLAREGLSAEEPPLDLDAPMTAAQQDADAGLPLPDPAGLSAHPANRHAWPRGQRLLLAQTVSPQLLRDLLDPARDHAQALRFIAADALSRMHPEYALNLRAPPAAQARQLRRIGLTEAA
jgi:hypothetical protein